MRALPLLLALLSATATAQNPFLPADDPVEVMILGTFHFHNPNADVVQMEGVDVLAPERQREIETVVEQLLAFRPTHIALEKPPSETDSINAHYARYREGRFDLTSNETHQLGFRLAAGMAHEALHPVDVRIGLDFDSLTTYAGQRDPAFMGWMQAYIGTATEMLNRMQAEESIGANLRYMNTPEGLAMAQQAYARMAEVGAGDTYVGAYVASQWYDRNLRIFGNLAALAEPGERVLFIVGQGHAPVLRQLVRDHPGLRLVEPNAYLFP